MTRGRTVPCRPERVFRVIRVCLIDDHETVLLGLRAMLEDAPDLHLTWAGTTVAEFLDSDVDTDIILLDLRLSDGSSPERNVTALQRTGAPVLAFTSAENPYHIRRAAQAGICGVLRKSESAPAIVAAIRTAATGETVPGLDWAAAIDGDPDLPAVGLSERQRDVLSLYASGEDAAAVASVLHISPQTVQDYVARIRTKYAESGRPARNKMDLYKRAVEDGYLPIPEVGS